MSRGVAGFMAALKAEALLGEDSELFAQIRSLCSDLQYSTEDGKFAFDDYFRTLVEAVDAIPKLELENDVAPGTETTYTIQLTTSAEQIVDDCDRVFRRLNQFEGRLRDAERKVASLKASFGAWYMVAATGLVSDLEDVKLPSTEIRKLGEAEFSRLRGGLDLSLETLLAAVKIEAAKVAHHKAAQKEKYDLGQDQANASWSSSLPAFGSAVSGERADQLSSPQDEEEEQGVPAFVSKRPTIKAAGDPLGIIDLGPPPAGPGIGDTLRIVTPKPGADGTFTEVFKGTFVKTGDPRPAVPVADDGPRTPRKRHVFDDEEV